MIFYPFEQVVKCNIGDAHAMGQKPVVFLRQVLGLVVNPDSMNDPSIPDDAKERAKAMVNIAHPDDRADLEKAIFETYNILI